jgi:hypothetical protein
MAQAKPELVKTKKSAEIRGAFNVRYRAAYYETFGEHPSAHNVHDAWMRVVVPVLIENQPGYTKLNVSEMALFVKACVHVALTEETQAK